MITARLHVHAAIHGKNLASHIIGPRAGEEYDCVSNFFWFAQASHGSHGFDVGESFFRHRSHHVGLNESWSHCIDGDAFASEFAGKALREGNDSTFGRGIVDLAKIACLANN